MKRQILRNKDAEYCNKEEGVPVRTLKTLHGLNATDVLAALPLVVSLK